LTFLNDIQRQGLDPRYALDIASVKKGIRPRGLLHVHALQAPGIHALLTTYGLRVVAERQLEGSRDPQSREGILSDLKPDTPAERLWHEIWFSAQETAPIDPTELFRAPGVHLSYPGCCVDAMLATRTLSSFYDMYINDPRHRAWEINRLTTVFTDGLLIPDFFPCSLACREARDFARPFLELAREILGAQRAADWIARAKQPYFVYQDSLYTALDYACDNNHLVATMESMSRIPLQDIGKTIARQKDQFGLVPFAHFYERPNDFLRITLKKEGQPLIELTAPPEAVAEARV
jgi:hypothetical protein